MPVCTINVTYKSAKIVCVQSVRLEVLAVVNVRIVVWACNAL